MWINSDESAWIFLKVRHRLKFNVHSRFTFPKDAGSMNLSVFLFGRASDV